MKLKYYLRGIGIGVIVTTIIFMISISLHKNELEQQNTSLQDAGSKTIAEVSSEKKDQDVATETTEITEIQTAESETTENSTQTETFGQEMQPKTNAEPDPETQKTLSETESNKTEKVRFKIGGGEYSDVTCNRLQEAGLIDDAEAFNKFLIQKDYDNLILPGVYDIPKGSTYDEIAELLITKVEQETTQ